MKIENIREVKARLNRLIGDLPKSGSIVVTRNGKACAVLMPITEDTDLESVALAQNRAFWAMYDAAIREAEKTAWVELDSAIEPPRKRSRARRRSPAAGSLSRKRKRR